MQYSHGALQRKKVSEKGFKGVSGDKGRAVDGNLPESI